MYSYAFIIFKKVQYAKTTQNRSLKLSKMHTSNLLYLYNQFLCKKCKINCYIKVTNIETKELYFKNALIFTETILLLLSELLD